MSTRKLILLALACGLAILLAGSIQLLRISNNEATTLAEGDSTELAGTVTASVVSSSVRDGAVWVVVRVSQAASATAPVTDAGAGWVLKAGSADPVRGVGVATAATPSCAGVAVAPGSTTECALRFEGEPEHEGTSVVTFVYVDRRASWTLAI